jgi:hypothetical protein
MTNRDNKHNDNDVKDARLRKDEAAKEIASSGDNRRLGDVDGNKNAGDARSPGADEPK